MNDRESLYEIADLKLEGIVGRLSDLGVRDYMDTLNDFTEKFPEMEENLKSALADEDYARYTKCLIVIKDALEAIHATELAQTCQREVYGITKMANIRHDKLEAQMAYILSNVSMLSIDIQMLDYKRRQAAEQPDYDGLSGAGSGADAKPEAKPDAKPEPAPDEDEEEVRKKTILAVDDQMIFLGALRNHLRGTPYHIVCTASGEDALHYLKNNRPDLFILDVIMPEMDGYELAQRIRDRGQTAPIIFLTGNSSRDSVTKAITAGAADFIVKPVNKEQVLERISKFI